VSLAAEDPQGVFGFKWGDSIQTVEKKAKTLGLRFSNKSEGVLVPIKDLQVFDYVGSPVELSNAKLSFSFYKGKLYDVAGFEESLSFSYFLRALQEKYGTGFKYPFEDRKDLLYFWYVEQTEIMLLDASGAPGKTKVIFGYSYSPTKKTVTKLSREKVEEIVNSLNSDLKEGL
jgi:hypothetical protein